MPKVTPLSDPEFPESPPAGPPPPAPAASETLSSTDTLERVPDGSAREVLLGNPYTDARVHSALYAALPGAMNLALDQLALKYPEVARYFAARFLQVALSAAIEVPAMTYSHEAGHFREATRQGGDPQIQLLGWMSGLTTFNYPAGKVPTAAQSAAVSGAGVNQETLNAQYMFQTWARQGTTSCPEALGFLLAQTNLALYSSMTAFYEARGIPIADSNDIRAYLGSLERAGQSVTTGQLTALALASDLASAPVWASLVGQLRYLATGEREVKVPAVRIGEAKVTFPSTHLLLTPQGPVLGADVMVSGLAPGTLELSFDLRTDLKGAAAGARLHDLPLADGVSASPFLRATIDEGKPGVLVGAEARIELGAGAQLTASIAFQHRDLLASPQGAANGVTAHVGVAIRY